MAAAAVRPAFSSWPRRDASLSVRRSGFPRVAKERARGFLELFEQLVTDPDELDRSPFPVRVIIGMPVGHARGGTRSTAPARTSPRSSPHASDSEHGAAALPAVAKSPDPSGAIDVEEESVVGAGAPR